MLEEPYFCVSSWSDSETIVQNDLSTFKLESFRVVVFTFPEILQRW